MADEVQKVTEKREVDKAGGVTTVRAESSESRDADVSKVAQVVWFLVGLLVALLLLRIVLSLLGANEANAFASFIYGLTDVFVAPFRGLLQIGEIQRGVSRFETETLVATLVYLLLGWAITSGIKLARKRPEIEA